MTNIYHSATKSFITLAKTITEEELTDGYIIVTDYEYDTYHINSIPIGKRLASDEDGRPTFVSNGISLEQYRVQYIKDIDEAAAEVTNHWTRFADEYKEREAAAIEFKDSGYTGDVSVYITSFADPAGMEYQAATDLILQQADDLRSLQSQLAAERMRKYELKAPELTLEEITALHDDVVAKIKALGESYE